MGALQQRLGLRQEGNEAPNSAFGKRDGHTSLWVLNFRMREDVRGSAGVRCAD